MAYEAFQAAMPEVGVAPDLGSSPTRADMCIVHNDGPQWRDLTAADFAGMRRKVVIDGHRIQGREAMQGVELTVPGG